MIEGRYFPPGSAKALPARIWRATDELRLSVEGREDILHPRIESVSDHLAKVPRKIVFADGATFEAPAEAGVEELLERPHGFFHFLNRIEANWRVAAIAAVLTIGLLAALYRWGIPLAASFAADVTPHAVLSAMDAGALQTVDRIFFGPAQTDQSRQDEVSALFAELKQAIGEERPDLRLLFRQGKRIGANAVALPGGTVVITDELIKLAKSDDEIAGVLAHEIGHYEGRHSLRQIYRVAGIAFMLGVIGGDSSQIVDDVVGQLTALQTLSYSREFETDADRRSVELMVRAGRDPTAFVTVLLRLMGDRQSARETGWLSTHPGTADRKKTVEEVARELGWKE